MLKIESNLHFLVDKGRGLVCQRRKKLSSRLRGSMEAAVRIRAKSWRKIWGISFYDKNILRMNSDESGIKESYFHLADEKAGNRLLYKIINTLTPEKGAPSFGSDLISADNLFRFQSEVIRKLAAEESCVIIGRCADYVLDGTEGLIRVFLYADIKVRESVCVSGISTRTKMSSKISTGSTGNAAIIIVIMQGATGRSRRIMTF